MAAPSSTRFIVRVVYTCMGMLIGTSVFCVFGFIYHNWNAALWGLSSAFPAAVTLYVHIANRNGKWDAYPRRLRFYMLMGCFIQLAGVSGFITYMTLAVSQKQELIISGPGYYLTCVWCFVVWKWGFILFYFSRMYRRKYDGVYTILPQEADEQYQNYSS